MRRKILYVATTFGLVLMGGAVWAVASRAGYESAPYKVIEKDGDIEIREYPDLMLASTNSKMDSQGRDGSFGRLFRYISGANENEQAISMTTPVFMQGDSDQSDGSMGFVMPTDVATAGAPQPKGEGVEIRKRKGGRFAVIRFSGKLDSELAKKQEAKLREWMTPRQLEGEATVEAAGYDPPFTPAALRRNEVLIRLKPSEADAIEKN